MECCVTDLKNKRVINSKTACVIGNVCDVEIDCSCGKVCALIIYGRSKCLGLLGREDDIRIKWCDVEVIGDETILVSFDYPPPPPPRPKNKKNGMFDGLFR